jgi:parallel beta-helix repeat protein
VIVANNTISGTKNQLYEQDNNGIHLEDLANVTLENNIIEGSNIGIKVLQVDEINVSNNKVLDSTTNFSESSVTMLSGNNNLGINPDTAYFQGNATGETIFDRKNGTTIAATLVGDITVTLPNGSFPSDVLTLRLTQDGTGSRKVNWPSNFKKSNGTLVLSTSPSAVDSITMMWSNTNWVEVGRALNVS